MTHQEIQDREIAEAYVRGRLNETEREAFENHYFACDQCFDQVQTLELFVGGVRTAAENGTLGPVVDAAEPRFLRLGFLIACAASLILAVATGWVYLFERPRLETELARQRTKAETRRKRLVDVENDLAGVKLAMAGVPGAQANLPLVMLEASRAASSTVVTVPAAARQLVIWLEPPPASAAATWRLELSDTGGVVVETVAGLVRNSYGALAVSIPAARLSPGSYRARLYVVQGARSELAGDYKFETRR